jgi:hypothetical protein
VAIEWPPARRDLPAWEREVTSLGLLHSARGVRGSSHGVYVHHVGEAGTPRTTKSLLPDAPNVEVVLQHFHQYCYKGSSAVVLYWSGLKSLGLAMDEHGEHQDLHVSTRRSVIPYVHGRMRVVLLKHWLFYRLPCVALRVLTPVVAFYSTRLLRSHYAPGPDRWPKGGCTLYRRGTIARNSQ